MSKFNVGLKSLLRQGLSETEFYGDLVYKLKKIICSDNLSAQFCQNNLCIATDCTLRYEPSHGWQFYFLFSMTRPRVRPQTL